MPNKMSILGWSAYTLLVVGGINWGLAGVFNFNLVNTLIPMVWLQKAVYGLIGLAGLFGLASWWWMIRR